MALPEQKQQNFERSTNRQPATGATGRFTQSENARRSGRVESPRGPFNVQVARTQNANPTDSRYQTIDERREAERAGETTSERLRAAPQPKKTNDVWTRFQNNVRAWNQQQRVGQFQKKQSFLNTVTKKGVGGKGVAKKAKLVRTTWITGSTCFALFSYQVLFWIISLMGLVMVSSNADSASWGLWLSTKLINVSTGMKGEYLFYFGYIIVIVIAVLQMLTILIVSALHGINPFRGKGLTTFAITFAVACIPFVQIIPVSFRWIYIIFKEHV